jgi:hypothetical protein
LFAIVDFDSLRGWEWLAGIPAGLFHAHPLHAEGRNTGVFTGLFHPHQARTRRKSELHTISYALAHAAWPAGDQRHPLTAIASLPPQTAAHVRAIYARGQELGRDPRTFSKLGDSTILNPHFLGPFDSDDYNLGDFAHLQPTIDRWRGSFERHGIAAHFGLHSWTVFDPMWADEAWCEAGEHPLACEVRLQNPSVLFVRLGSNDAGAPDGFRYNVRQVIEFCLDHGIIPIIGTKADRFEGSNENNDILRELAAEYAVPLWDFDLLAGTLPNRGLDEDGVHLVIDNLPHDYTDPAALTRGHAMQDLSALIALDQIRRIIE